MPWSRFALEGTFSLELPAEIAAVTAIVQAPGFGTQAFPLVIDGSPLALTVSEAAGEISIALPAEDADPSSTGRITLFQNGSEVPLSLLGPTGNSSDLRLPTLAPGEYSACLVRKSVESTASLERVPDSSGVACDSGQLAAGVTLVLTPGEGD